MDNRAISDDLVAWAKHVVALPEQERESQHDGPDAGLLAYLSKYPGGAMTKRATLGALDRVIKLLELSGDLIPAVFLAMIKRELDGTAERDDEYWKNIDWSKMPRFETGKLDG